MIYGMEPPVSDVTEAFWNATRDGKLVLQWCNDCNKYVFYPREACPTCLGFNLEWRDASGKGEVYAVSVQHKPMNPTIKELYAVALVELEEGVRLMTNVVGCDPESVTVGMPVQVSWEALSDGRNLPKFAPVG